MNYIQLIVRYPPNDVCVESWYNLLFQ